MSNSCLSFFSSQIEIPVPDEDLSLGEVYQFILGPEWGKSKQEITNSEGISQIDVNDNR
jgi:hypothetical protein